MSAPEKSIEQLEQELSEAERIAAALREELERAKWCAEFDGVSD